MGVAVGDIPAAAVAAGVAEETGVSSARNTRGEKCKTSVLKATTRNSDRLTDRRFIFSAFSYPRCAIRVRFDSQGVSYRYTIVQPSDFGQIASFLSILI